MVFIMAAITLKNIPEATHRALKKHARAQGRSLNKEILMRLDASINAPSIKAESILASVDLVRDDGVRLDPGLMEKALSTGRP